MTTQPDTTQTTTKTDLSALGWDANQIVTLWIRSESVGMAGTIDHSVEDEESPGSCDCNEHTDTIAGHVGDALWYLENSRHTYRRKVARSILNHFNVEIAQ